MTKRKKVHSIIKNPITIVVPIVLVALFGWRYYIRVLNEPSHAQHDVLAQQSDFEQVNGQGVPVGWSPSGTTPTDYSFSRGRGYEGGTATTISLLTTEGGSLDLSSPMVSLTPGKTYLYKGYYKSNVPLYLLVKYYYKDGSSSLDMIQQYGSSNNWTTDSTAFKAASNATKMQVVYKLASRGTVWLDKAYVDEPSTGVYVAEQPVNGPNLINNAGLSQQGSATPTGWRTYNYGTNDATFQTLNANGMAYLRTQILTYASGEAEWNHEVVPANSGEYMKFSLTYRSTAPTQMQAQYALANGSTQTTALFSLPTAEDWTQVQAFAEAPANAVSVSLQGVLASRGTLDTRDYSVQNLTKPGARTFKRPLISIVFSDGWASSYTTGGRIMDFVGYKGTYYINPSSIGSPSFLSNAQVQSLVGSGNEAATEGYDYVDLTDLNSQQLQREMWLAKDYFTGEFGNSAVDFMPTLGLTDSQVAWYEHQYFRSGLSASEGINTKQNLDIYNLKTLYVDSNTTSQRFQTALQQTANSDGWLILVYHRVADGISSTSVVPSQEFTNQIEQIDQSGITVKTVTGALNEIQAQ